MPTQRPPSSTTGTPGSSCSRSSAITSSTGVSRCTVAGSESMMSRHVWHRRARLSERQPGGSASITSPAIDVSAPTRSAAARARRARGRARRAQAAVEGRRGPWRAARRSRPESTSPVPAVASAGVPPRADRHARRRARDDRVVALEQRRPRRCARRPRGRGASRCARDLVGRGVRAAGRARPRGRQHGRRVALARAARARPAWAFRPSASISSGVCDRARQPAGERLGAVGRGRGPGRAPRRRRARPSPATPRRRPACGAVRVGQPAGHLLEQAQLERCCTDAGHAPPGRSRRRRAGRRGRPSWARRSGRRAAGTTTHARVNFEPLRRRGADRGRARRSEIRPARSARGRAARDADLDHLDRAGVRLARLTQSPTLAAWKVASPSARTASPATSPVVASTPRGHVAGDDRRVLRVDRRDRARRRGSRGAPVEAGAEQRVDDHARRPRARSASNGSGGVAGQALEVDARRRRAARRGRRPRARRPRGRPRAAAAPRPARRRRCCPCRRRRATGPGRRRLAAPRPGPRRPLHQVERRARPRSLDRPGVHGAHLARPRRADRASRAAGSPARSGRPRRPAPCRCG